MGSRLTEEKNMKVSKSRLAGLILLSMTIAYIVALHTSVQNYNAWCKEELLEYPQEIRSYVDFNPFWVTRLGNFMFLLSIALVFCWVVFLYATSNSKPKTSIIALALIVFAGSFFCRSAWGRGKRGQDGNRCQVDLQQCPTEKVVEHIGLGRLRKASEFLYDHPFRRRT